MATVQLIRSATLKISYGGTIFLIDPMLGNVGTIESYGNLAPNPTQPLPFTIKEVLEGVDAVLVSHLHKDHFDDAAREQISKKIPIYCQPGDFEQIAKSGFENVSEIENQTYVAGINIYRTSGNHGRGPIEKLMGQVSGFVLKTENEPTIYIIGDSIFNDKVKLAIDAHKPDVIITNSGGAFIPGYEEDLILLDEQETLEIASYANESKIIAVHLEALDHCTVNRASLSRAFLQSSIEKERIFIPLDGEKLIFEN